MKACALTQSIGMVMGSISNSSPKYYLEEIKRIDLCLANKYLSNQISWPIVAMYFLSKVYIAMTTQVNFLPVMLLLDNGHYWEDTIGAAPQVFCLRCLHFAEILR